MNPQTHMDRGHMFEPELTRLDRKTILRIKFEGISQLRKAEQKNYFVEKKRARDLRRYNSIIEKQNTRNTPNSSEPQLLKTQLHLEDQI